MLNFQSPVICEAVREELTKQNASVGVTECSRKQLQLQLNRAQLEWVSILVFYLTTAVVDWLFT